MRPGNVERERNGVSLRAQDNKAWELLKTSPKKEERKLSLRRAIKVLQQLSFDPKTSLVANKNGEINPIRKTLFTPLNVVRGFLA